MKCYSPAYNKAAKTAVPCGKCPACLASKRADWSFRINEELRTHTSAFFCTFTYSDDKLPLNKGHPTLRRSDFQSYMKNLRNTTKNKLKYFACGEYGSNTHRPHYHAIIFNYPAELRHLLALEWRNGYTTIDQVNAARIHYITKYILKKSDSYDEVEPPFNLVSKGLGKNYLINTDMHKNFLSSNVSFNGYKQRMPRYYKDKIFSEHDKLLLRKQNEKIQDDTENKALIKAKKKNRNYFAYEVELQEQFKKKASKNIKKDLL